MWKQFCSAHGKLIWHMHTLLSPSAKGYFTLAPNGACQKNHKQPLTLVSLLNLLIACLTWSHCKPSVIILTLKHPTASVLSERRSSVWEGGVRVTALWALYLQGASLWDACYIRVQLSNRGTFQWHLKYTDKPNTLHCNFLWYIRKFTFRFSTVSHNHIRQV